MTSLTAPVQDRRLFAIGIILSAYILFTICDSAAKWLALSGMPPTQVAFGRYLIQFAFLAGLVLPRSGLAALKTRRPVLQIVRALGLLGMTVFNFFAILYLPLTVTSSIKFGMPLLITALSVPFLGETVGWKRWLAIAVGFIGILIVIQPWGAEFHWATLLSLGCILSGALYFILTRKLTATESTLTMQLYAGLVGMVLLAPLAIADWVWPEGWLSWGLFILIGLSAMAGHHIAIVAHRYAPASVLAPFVYTQIIWMTLSSWLIFAEPPTAWLFVGAPLVIGSGLYIWLRERANAQTRVTAVAAPEAADAAAAESARNR